MRAALDAAISPASTRPSAISSRCARARARRIGGCSPRASTRSNAWRRRRGLAGAQAGDDPRAARRADRSCSSMRRRRSTRTGCIRRRSSLPPRPTSARRSTGSTPTSPRRGRCCRGRPVGRRLDFLAQEFNREVNTLCAKSNDRGADRHRPGTEGGGRPVPRAGPESGMSDARRNRGHAPWPDAGAVLAVGRRQVDA